MPQSKGLKWVRPLDKVPFPNVWDEFESKESKGSDKFVKYRIQDLPEDRFDDAVQHLIDNFLADEPFSVYHGSANNKEYVDDLVRLWRGAMEQKTSIVCFREGSDEIIALNVLIVNTRNDTFMKEIAEQTKSRGLNDVLKVIDICYETFTPYDKYGVDCYLGSFALSVDRKYRGLAMGTRMLKARARLAAPLGLKITETLFTSDYSNVNADQAGFQLDVEFTFDELNEINPDFHFKNFPSSKVTIKTLIF